MNVILADTNKLFGIFRAVVLEQSDLSRSELAYFIRNHTVYVSTFILQELESISHRYNLPIQDAHFTLFVQMLGLEVYRSKLSLHDSYLGCVYDIHDAQLVQDAVELGATHILTDNLKDFNIVKIKDTYDISIVSRLEEII